MHLESPVLVGRRTAVLAGLLALMPPLVLAGTASAEIVASLPLQRGFYVSKQATCATASNATLILVTRQGMNVSRVITRFRKIDKVGPKTYVVTAVSEELNGQASPPESVTYEIPNATTFRGKEGNGTYEYRYCPQASLPSPWRNNDIRDIIR